MRSNFNVIVWTSVLCALSISCTPANRTENYQRNLDTQKNQPNFSTVYIGTTAGSGEPKSQTTMSDIETVLGHNKGDSEHSLQLLTNYIRPILSEPGTEDALRQISNAFSLKYETIMSDENDGIDYQALSPLLDAIEHNKNKEQLKQLVDVWPESFRGFALKSFLSALRFGVCVDIESKLLKKERVDSNLLCERLDYGRISDWYYDEKSGIGNFALNDMKINVYQLSFNPTTNNVDYNLVRQWSNNWQISIDAPGYFKAKRMDLNQYRIDFANDSDADPFEWTGSVAPGVTNLPSLPAGAKNPLDGSDNGNEPDGDIWRRDLNHRLFASGMSVRVTNIEETLYQMQEVPATGDPNNYKDPTSDREFLRTNIIEGPTTLPSFDPQMLSSTDSCIDIMLNLTNGYPATINDHPFSAAQPDEELGWCLGRCPHPVIQNSR